MRLADFSETKATDLVCFFVAKEGGAIDLLKVVKLVYIANRASLFKYKAPITYEPLFSLPCGPVPSTTYDLLKGEVATSEYWRRHIAPRDGNTIRVIEGNFDLSSLDSIEKELLEDVWSEYGRFSGKQLIKITHGFPEYVDPNGSSLPIEIEDLFVKNEKSDIELQAATAMMSMRRSMDRLAKRSVHRIR